MSRLTACAVMFLALTWQAHGAALLPGGGTSKADALLGTCASGEIIKMSGSTPICAADSTGSGSLGSSLTSTTNDLTSSSSTWLFAGATEDLLLTYTSNTATFTSSTGIVNTVFPVTVTATTFAGALSGNADTATLATTATTATNLVGSGSISGAVDLATAEVNGVLGVANGGTGISVGSEGWTIGDDTELLVTLYFDAIGVSDGSIGSDASGLTFNADYGNVVVTIADTIGTFAIVGGGTTDATVVLPATSVGQSEITLEAIDVTRLDRVDGDTYNDEDCLTYETTGTGGTLEWQPCAAAALDNLTDATITSPATGAILVKSAGDWIDGPIDLADSDAVGSSILPVANGGTGVAALGTGIVTALGVNTGTAGAPAILIANDIAILGTSPIATTACASTVIVSAPGVLTTDVIQWTPNLPIQGLNGYAPLTSGGLSIYSHPTADNVNFTVCNPTTSSVTPGAVTLNWRVVR